MNPNTEHYTIFFSYYGSDTVRLHSQYTDDQVSVEKLYQMFKERLKAELQQEEDR